MLVINEEIKRTAHCKRIKPEGRAAQTDSSSICFKAHLRQAETDLFNYSSCHVPTVKLSRQKQLYVSFCFSRCLETL